jgi:transposase
MNTGRPVFAQLMKLVHPEVFHRCVNRFHGQERLRSFSCWDQFLCMAFGQLTFRDSLRSTVDCLIARQDRLYQMGFRGPIRRSTLADANERRDWRIYAHLAQTLIRKARRLYANESLAVDLDATTYALDSTTIDLCLNIFRWAKFRKTKGAIKLHTLLDLRGPIPTFIHISDGKVHDVKVMDMIPIEPGAFYVMDRGYVDFERLHTFQDLGAFFIIRAKHSLKYVRLKSQEVDISTGLRSDQIIRLKTFYSLKGYPDRLRRIRYYDNETQRFFIYLTNHLTLPPLTIALLYKSRWQVELFFKWIKQNLRIKSFFGRSPNAVKTQVWIAVCVYVLVAILKKELNLPGSLHQILQILSVSTFEKVQINQLFTEYSRKFYIDENCNQLELFDL